MRENRLYLVTVHLEVIAVDSDEAERAVERIMYNTAETIICHESCNPRRLWASSILPNAIKGDKSADEKVEP